MVADCARHQIVDLSSLIFLSVLNLSYFFTCSEGVAKAETLVSNVNAAEFWYHSNPSSVMVQACEYNNKCCKNCYSFVRE